MFRKSINARYRTATGEIDVARLKTDVPIAEVAGMVTRLRRSGRELKGLCPLHTEDSPSFQVSEGKGLFHCFGCRKGGDVISLVQEMSGRSFIEACEWLVGSEWNAGPRDIETIGHAREKRQLAIARAKQEWRLGLAIDGTPAEDYLASRGIHGQVPGCIRFGWPPRWWRDDGSEGPRRPAMLSACQDGDGKVSGIQRVFLDSRGRKVARGEPRLCLGQIRGGALRLGPVRPRIMLASAVEDALSLTRMFPGATVWAAFGDANLPHVALPDVVREVVLCGDADAPGRMAVAAARSAFEARGLVVEDLLPRAGAKDFNEEWQLLHA